MQHAPSAPVVPVAPGGYGAHAASAPPMPPQAFLQSSQQVPPRASGVPAYGAYPPAQRLPIATPPPMPSPFTGPPPFRGPVAPGQWARPRMIPTQSSSMPVILTVIAIVLGGLFVATCAAVHAACG